MKKTLVLSPHNPFNRSNGGENRIYLIMKELAKKNKIILVCPNGKTEKIKNIKIYQEFENKAKEKILNFHLIKRLKYIIKRENPDEIQIEFPWQAIDLWAINQKYTLTEHNVEFLRFKRTKSLIWPVLYFYELLTCKFAKKIICVSEKDREFLIKYFNLNSKKIEIVENPVDKKAFYPNPNVKSKIRKELELKNEKFILFFGQLDYQPNVEAIQNIKEKIIPLLNKKTSNYKIVICGKGDGKGALKNYKNRNLIFKGFVDKIADYINACDVVIAPLNSGSGTRIKILEALACKKRVIATSIGAEGIKSNKYLEVEDDWNKFVEKI